MKKLLKIVIFNYMCLKVLSVPINLKSHKINSNTKSKKTVREIFVVCMADKELISCYIKNYKVRR